MVKSKSIDLTSITAGTGGVVSLGPLTYGKLATIEVVQDSVSAVGLTLRVVQSVSGRTWFDVLQDETDDTSVIEVTTDNASEPILMQTDFGAGEIGLFVDRPGGVTGTLNISMVTNSTI